MKEKTLAQVDFNTIYETLKKDYGIEIKLPKGGKIGQGPELRTATVGDIISTLLPYVFVLAGLILFAYLIWGGFELLTSTGDPESIKKAQAKITNAIIGFIIIFTSYWLAQILEIVFGITILG